MTAEQSELQRLLDVTPDNLHQTAKVLVAELEVIQRFYTFTPGVSEESKALAIEKARENANQLSLGIGSAISAGIAGCKRIGAEVPAEADGKLETAVAIATKILAITNLTEATALVATLEN